MGLAYRINNDPGYNEYYLTIRRGKLDLHADMPTIKTAKSYSHDRGRVGNWSHASRRRFLDALLSINWESVESARLFVTLTYPNLFTLDGAVCKGHLDAWLKRVERKYGPVTFGWKREFQERGAAHYHGVLVADIDGWEADQQASLEAAQQFLKSAWVEVVNSGDPLHAEHGAEIEIQRDARKHSTYLAFYMCKGNQDKVPQQWSDIQRQCTYDEAFRNPGRWWGFWRLDRLPQSIEHHKITAAQFQEGRDAIRQALAEAGVLRACKNCDGDLYADIPAEVNISYIEFDPEKLAAVKQKILAET